MGAFSKTGQALAFCATVACGWGTAGGQSKLVELEQSFEPARYEPLAGSVVGLMVAEPREALAVEGRSGVDAYVFSCGEGSYRWFEVPYPLDDKTSFTLRDYKVPVGPKGDSEKAYPCVGSPTPQVMKKMGIDTPFALVQVEVNSGLGAPVSMYPFISTGVRILHKTPAYALNPVEVTRDANERFKTQRDALLKEIGVRLPELAAAESRELHGERQIRDVVNLTWLPDTERVRFLFRIIGNQQTYRRVPTAEMEFPAEKDGRDFQVEASVAFEYSRSGRFVGETVLPTKLGARKLPPRPAMKVMRNSKEHVYVQRHYEALEGHTIGVIVSGGEEALSARGVMITRDELVFGRGASDYRMVALSAPHAGDAEQRKFEAPVLTTAGDTRTYPGATSLTGANAKPLGIVAPFSLVDLEVNSGAGSAVESSMIATQIKVLQKTEAYPLDPAEVMRDAREKYASYKKTRADDFDKELRGLAGSVVGGQAMTGPRETQELMFVTWLPETERVQVTFEITMTDGAYAYASTFVGRFQTQLMRYGKQFGLKHSLVLEYSKAGNLVREKALTTGVFTRDLPKPER